MSDINNHRLLEPLTYDAVSDNGNIDTLYSFRSQSIFHPALNNSLTSIIAGNEVESPYKINDLVVVSQTTTPYLTVYMSNDNSLNYYKLEDFTVASNSNQIMSIQVNNKGDRFATTHIDGGDFIVCFYQIVTGKVVHTNTFNLGISASGVNNTANYIKNDLEYFMMTSASVIGGYNLQVFKIENSVITKLDSSLLFPDLSGLNVIDITINEETDKLVLLTDSSKYLYVYNININNDLFSYISVTMGTENNNDISPRRVSYRGNKLAVGFNATDRAQLSLRISSVVATSGTFTLTTIQNKNTSFISTSTTKYVQLSYNGDYVFHNGDTDFYGYYDTNTQNYEILNSITMRGVEEWSFNKICIKQGSLFTSDIDNSTRMRIGKIENISGTMYINNESLVNSVFPYTNSSSIKSYLGNNNNRLFVNLPDNPMFYHKNGNRYEYINSLYPTGGDTNFKLSRTGTYAVANNSSNASLYKYNGTTFTKLSITFTNNLNNAKFNDIDLNNEFIAVGGSSPIDFSYVYLNVFRMSSDTPTNIISLSDTGTSVTLVKFSKTGKYLLVGIRTGTLLYPSYSVRIYVKSGSTYVLGSTLSDVNADTAEFVSDDTKVVLSSSLGLVKVYSVNTTTNVFTFVKDNILSGLGTITDLQINPENKYISISSTNSVNLYRLKLDSTLVKCYVAPALKNYNYSNSNFIDNQTLLVMGVFNTGPVVSNLFIYENFTNTTNRSPLFKG